MKKTIFALFLVFFSILSQANAYNYQQATEQERAQTQGWWPVFQFVIWPGIPPYTDKAVDGIRTGFPLSGGAGAVNGLEIAPALAYSDYVYGIQLSGIMNHSKIAEGFRLGLINTSTEWMCL